MPELGAARTRMVTYCIVPRSLGPDAFGTVRSALAGAEGLEVIAERRTGERRAEAERRARQTRRSLDERRVEGRRACERRAALVVADTPKLPPKIRWLAPQLRFVKGVEPRGIHDEDVDTDRLVVLFQQGDEDAFGALYMRYFDRLYAYLVVILGDDHAAEDATQEVFARAMRALPRYERRAAPFRAWLFRIARNHALDLLRTAGRLELVGDFSERLDAEPARHSDAHETVGWLSDRELAMFVERLPLAQRQVVMLRFMLDLATADIAAIMGRSTGDVRTLQSRAMRYLRERLAAVRADHGGRLTATARSLPRRSRVLDARSRPAAHRVPRTSRI